MCRTPWTSRPSGRTGPPAITGSSRPATRAGSLRSRASRWPQETLRNPDASPLLKAAAALRSWLDVMRLLIERVVGWVPPFLEHLDAWLRDQLGPRWWDDFGWGAD